MRNIFATLELEENPEYVTELEKKFSLQLPPIFKAYAQTFKYGVFNTLPKHRIYHINHDEIGYEGIDFTLEFNLEVYFEQGDCYQRDEILPFASSGYPCGICVGLNELNKDKIYLYVDNNELLLIADNIFEFISQLTEMHWDSF